VIPMSGRRCLVEWLALLPYGTREKSIGFILGDQRAIVFEQKRRIRRIVSELEVHH